MTPALLVVARLRMRAAMSRAKSETLAGGGTATTIRLQSGLGLDRSAPPEREEFINCGLYTSNEFKPDARRERERWRHHAIVGQNVPTAVRQSGHAFGIGVPARVGRSFGSHDS